MNWVNGNWNIKLIKDYLQHQKFIILNNMMVNNNKDVRGLIKNHYLINYFNN